MIMENLNFKTDIATRLNLDIKTIYDISQIKNTNLNNFF